MKNLWLYGILATFILFITLMVSFAVMASHHKADLVVRDYYKAEIEYQNRIDRMRNTEKLQEKPQITLEQKSLTLTLSPEMAANFAEGKLSFYRPDAPMLDFYRLVKGDSSTVIRVPHTQFKPGAWAAKLEWLCAGKGYYLEKSFIIR